VAEDNVERTRQALEYFNRGDREALWAMAAPNAEIIPLRAALEGTVYRGENAFAEFWEAVDETWETLRIEADEISRLRRSDAHRRASSRARPRHRRRGRFTDRVRAGDRRRGQDDDCAGVELPGSQAVHTLDQGPPIHSAFHGVPPSMLG
jgi:hypothetical protein